MFKIASGAAALAVLLLSACTSGVQPVSTTPALAPLTPTVTFTSASANVMAGETTTLTWGTTDATSCTASGNWSGSKATSGTEATAVLSANATFTLDCTGAGGTVSASVTVMVGPPPTPTVNLSASPATVSMGGSSMLTWTSTNTTNCSASGGWSGAQLLNGTATVGPINSDTTYTLSCIGPGGSVATSATVTVSVTTSIPTVTLAPSPSTVSAGGTASLTWTSTNATSCTASGGWSGAQILSGSAMVGPLNATTLYTLTCTGAGGMGSASAVVVVGSASGVTVTPRIAPLTLSQTQQFTAVVAAGGPVTWSVDGIVHGNSAVGTINASGLYLPPSSAGTHAITAFSVADLTKAGTATAAVTDLVGIYTYHNDLARSGQNSREYALTKAAVSGGTFGRRWTCAVDGDVYAQPLYVANLAIAGGTHNVVFVATNHDSVYAFDADSGNCTPLWQRSFLGTGVTTIPLSDVLALLPSCQDVQTEFGIIGTPVIDRASNTLFLVAATKEGTNFVQRLHALSLTTGMDQSRSPIDITASAARSGGRSPATFDALLELQRSGLVFSGGGVFIAWTSHCDVGAYYGWLARYEGTTLNQTAVFNVAPNGGAGGIWMSGAAPAVDSSGAVYLSTGNGSFTNTASNLPPVSPNNDFSMSFLNLEPNTLTLQDFYTPSQELAWSNLDLDISSTGVMVLPDGAGPVGHLNLLFGSDKQGHLWMLDRALLGEYSPTGENVTQYISVPNLSGTGFLALFTPPAFYNGTVYFGATGNPVMAIPLSGGRLSATAQNVAIPSSSTVENYPFPGASTVISASPTSEGIVWALDNAVYANATRAAAPAVLRAYDASNLGTRLYTSSAVTGDAGGNSVKFTLPVVANGHVYIGGGRQLTVYGLAP